MKNKFWVSILTLVCLCVLCLTVFVGCGNGNSGSGISFNTLVLDDKKANVKVSNDTTEYSFEGEITVKGNAQYIVSLNKRGTQALESKTVTLKEGDNVFYILESIKEEVTNVYEVTIRRRVMYEVTFDTKGGKAVDAQMVEEDGLATTAETSKIGHDFTGWDYDFSTPITQNTKITAKYTIKSEMNIFSFTATDKTCVISGLKDTKTTMEVILPDYVTSVGDRAFFDCAELESITLNDGLKTIGKRAFGDCAKLKTIKIPASVETIGEEAFAGCSSLATISLSEGLKTIDKKAFNNCYKLLTVTIPSTVTSVGDRAFDGCQKLIEVISNSTNVKIEKGKTTNGYLGYYALSVFNQGETVTNKLVNTDGFVVFTNGSEKFFMDYLGTATQIVLPAEVTKIYAYALESNNFLESVTLGDNVTVIDNNAFEYCKILTTIVLGKKVSRIGDFAFHACGSLANITFNEGLLSVGEYSFHGCGSLTKLKLPQTLSSMGKSAFEFCNSLKIVYIPNSLKVISERGFYGCSALESIVVGTGLTIIGGAAFHECNNLSAVYYEGTKATWRGIAVDYEYNEVLVWIQFYYYKETTPHLNDNGTAYDGDYYYYDENGEPVIWVYKKP